MNRLRLIPLLVLTCAAWIVGVALGVPAPDGQKCQDGVGDCQVGLCCAINYDPQPPNFLLVKVNQLSPICVTVPQPPVVTCNPDTVGSFACQGDEYFWAPPDPTWCMAFDNNGQEKTPIGQNVCPIMQCIK